MSRRERIVEGLTTSDNGLPVFEDEQQFQDYLEVKFEQSGYTAIQEVRPDRSRYKADLLLIHDDYGKIGVELKWHTGGSDAATAHQQIVRQYSGKKYLGDRVDKWVYAPYMPKYQSEQSDEFDSRFHKGKMEVVENFFHKYGIGTINVHCSPNVVIRWGQSRDYCLPAFSMKGRDFTETPDLQKIENRIMGRLYDQN